MKKVLIFSLPGLGDVLLTTPLIRSIKLALPDSQIDLMVNQGTAGILEGNSDVNSVFTCHKYSTILDYLMMFRSTAFKYDFSFSISASDRSFWCSLLAAKKRYSIYKAFRFQDFWKFLGTHHQVVDDNNIHIVERNLKLLDFLSIPRCYDIAPPIDDSTLPKISDKYVVIHPYPKMPFKLWQIDKWQEVIRYLQSLNLKVVLSGGTSMHEQEYLSNLENENTIKLAGKLSLAGTVKLIRQAELYIGVDTGTTHLAAATGVMVIALYGPTSPVRWGPWPTGYKDNNPPFNGNSTYQSVGNVTVIKSYCSFCNLCKNNKHDESVPSQCMQKISVNELRQAIDLYFTSKTRSVIN